MLQRLLLGLITLIATAASTLGHAGAATLGVAVDGINSHSTVGTTANLPILGGISIKYSSP